MDASIDFSGVLRGSIADGGGGGGGDTVIITPVVTSGTKIADVSVNGDNKDLYAPNPTQVSVNQEQQSGTKIGSIEVNGVEVDLYAPNPTEVTVDQVQQSGTKIATIGVNGQSTDIYAPEGGGHVYSTTERVVGKWVDNRNVYERTYILSNMNIASRSAYVINSELTDSYIDVLMKKCASYKISGYNYLYTDTVGSQCIEIARGSNGLYLENFSDFIITDAMIIVQYVKIE